MSKSSRTFKTCPVWVKRKLMGRKKRTLKLYRRWRRMLDRSKKEHKKMLAYAKTHGFEYCMEVMM